MSTTELPTYRHVEDIYGYMERGYLLSEVKNMNNQQGTSVLLKKDPTTTQTNNNDLCDYVSYILTCGCFSCFGSDDERASLIGSPQTVWINLSNEVDFNTLNSDFLRWQSERNRTQSADFSHGEVQK